MRFDEFAGRLDPLVAVLILPSTTQTAASPCRSVRNTVVPRPRVGREPSGSVGHSRCRVRRRSPIPPGPRPSRRPAAPWPNRDAAARTPPPEGRPRHSAVAAAPRSGHRRSSGSECRTTGPSARRNRCSRRNRCRGRRRPGRAPRTPSRHCPSGFPWADRQRGSDEPPPGRSPSAKRRWRRIGPTPMAPTVRPASTPESPSTWSACRWVSTTSGTVAMCSRVRQASIRPDSVPRRRRRRHRPRRSRAPCRHPGRPRRPPDTQPGRRPADRDDLGRNQYHPGSDDDREYQGPDPSAAQDQQSGDHQAGQAEDTRNTRRPGHGG